MKKKIIYSLLILLTFGFEVNAQKAKSTESPKSETQTEKPKVPTPTDRARRFLLRYVNMMDTTKMQSLKDKFSQGFGDVAKVDTMNWIAQYYAGYTLALNAIEKQKDPKHQDQILLNALEYINKAEKIAPKESEVILLKGLITGMRIFVDPTKGEKLGKETSELYEKAKKLNPENPRVYLLMGEMAYNAPEDKGGDKKVAIENFEIALEKFKSFKNDDPTFPHWGLDRTKQMLSQAKNKK
jgi:hypothetical protein